ncbi:uncharacterized protein LOC144785483 [Lissotriton helveticus]
MSVLQCLDCVRTCPEGTRRVHGFPQPRDSTTSRDDKGILLGAGMLPRAFCARLRPPCLRLPMGSPVVMTRMMMLNRQPVNPVQNLPPCQVVTPLEMLEVF